MREIKFRLWNGKYYELPTDKADGCALISLMGKVYENGRDGAELSFDDYTIEEYTGLKDKNGVEIYENDWVAPYKAQIVYSDVGSWGYRHKGQDYITPLFHDNIKNIEVIGNIHNE